MMTRNQIETKQGKSFWSYGIIILLLSLGGPAWAISLSFYNITNNNPVSAAIGEAQLFVDVNPFIEVEDSQVLFTFRNIGPEACSITDVYFEDGSLLGISDIFDEDPGVAFSQGASPSNLPGANNASPPFVTAKGFSADSDPPAQPNGVNPNETLGILFDLQPSKNYNDVLADLVSGNLRIGIHVQGFAGGWSESFVNNKKFPPDYDDPSVPEPTTLLGVFMAAGALTRYAQKRRTIH